MKAHRSPLARRTPSPLVGEGWGRGSGGDAEASTHAHFLPTPTPIPSPTRLGARERGPGGGGEQRAGCSEINVAGATLVADCAGALYWPEERLLVVADLHLEKGSAFAARGVLLPPYDTAATLARLAMLIERYAPRLVIALGDSFHDGGGPARMSDISRAGLKSLQRGRDWLWIAGNHDPDPADNIGGRFAEILALGPLTFRHEPSPHPVRRRNRRPSASAGADRAPRPRREPALLCLRRQAAGHAGLRRLCGRPQCARPRHRVVVRRAGVHRAHAERTAHLRRRRGALSGGLI